MPRAATLRSFARPPWWTLFAVAFGGLLLSAFGQAMAVVPALCSSGAIDRLIAVGGSDAFALAFVLNPPGLVMSAWAAMLLAMMPPLLAAPLMHVWRSSLPRRRGWSCGLFVLGYGAVWMAAGPLLVALAVALRLLAPGGGWLLAGLVTWALVWSACPWQRAALNRAHRLPRIGLFGSAAVRECLRYGVVHALWCIASCWPWMLAATAAEDWHLLFMVAAGAVMLGERLAPPESPRWRWPLVVAALVTPVALAPLRGWIRHG